MGVRIRTWVLYAGFGRAPVKSIVDVLLPGCILSPRPLSFELKIIGMFEQNRQIMKRGWIIWGTGVIMAALTGCYFDGPCIDGTGPVISEIRVTESFSAVTNTGSFRVQVFLSDSCSVEVRAQENLLPLIETYVSGNSLIIKTKTGTCIGPASPMVIHVTLPFIEELKLTGSGNLELDEAAGDFFECANSGSGSVHVGRVAAGEMVIGNSGSGTIFVDESDVEEVTLVQSGSGIIEAAAVYGSSDVSVRHSSSGRVRSTIVDGIHVSGILSGSGRIDLTGGSDEADFTLSASGRIDALELMVAEVKATNSGSGNIHVYATESLEATIIGSGDIIYRGDPVISYRITGSGDLVHY